MVRKHATVLQVGEVIDELGPQLVLDKQKSWGDGVMLSLLDLVSGKEYYSFAALDDVDVIQ